MTALPSFEAFAPQEFISFRVADQEFCVDIMSVRELRGWAPATPLPHAPAYMRGVVNLRGTLLPVIDMAARLGMAGAEPDARHVVIVVWIRGKLVGLLVDAVCDIIQVSPEALQPAPQLSDGGAGDFVSTLLAMDERVLGVLCLDRVLPPADLEDA